MAGGKGGARGPMPREVQVSKKMSWLLRHGAEKEGLQLREGGYISVKDVVSFLFSLSLSSIFHLHTVIFSIFILFRILRIRPHKKHSSRALETGASKIHIP